MQTSPQRGTSTAILVVDDDALITLNIVDHLTDIGYRVFEAYSGREALAILEAHPEIGALITDYSMPLMTGVELAEKARVMRPCLKVLLATGYADLPEGIACEFMRIEKPFREDELTAKLDELLAHKTAE